MINALYIGIFYVTNKDMILFDLFVLDEENKETEDTFQVSYILNLSSKSLVIAISLDFLM